MVSFTTLAALLNSLPRTDLYLGGPLLAGLVVVALSSFAPMILPVTAVGTLAATQ